MGSGCPHRPRAMRATCLHFTGNYSGTGFAVGNSPGGVLITYAAAEAKVVHPLDLVGVAHG